MSESESDHQSTHNELSPVGQLEANSFYNSYMNETKQSKLALILAEIQIMSMDGGGWFLVRLMISSD